MSVREIRAKIAELREELRHAERDERQSILDEISMYKALLNR